MKNRRPKRRRQGTLAVDALAGAAAGAAVGVAAGPAGAAAGAIVGGSIGAAVGVAEEQDALRRAAHDAALDEEVGVLGGELGAPNLKHLPARVGAYSHASVGGRARAERHPAEGPISGLDDED